MPARGKAKRRDYFLKMAKEAEDMAASARDGQARESWERVARAYRELAAKDSDFGR
jgi:hypothetical protein